MKLTYRYAIAAVVMAFALFLLSPTFLPQDTVSYTHLNASRSASPPSCARPSVIKSGWSR